MHFLFQHLYKREGAKDHLIAVEERVEVGASIFNLIVLTALLYLFLSGAGKAYLKTPSGSMLASILLVGGFGANLVQLLWFVQLKRERRPLDRRKACDALTGLLERGFFEEMLDEEVRRAGRYHYPVSLCLIDLDEFKIYNAQHGRKGADEVLIRFSRFLSSSTRLADSIARYGADEFCILLPHTDLGSAGKFLQRILGQTQKETGMTFSAGLTSYRIGEEKQQLLERATAALQEARHVGEHRVFCFVDYEGGRKIERY